MSTFSYEQTLLELHNVCLSYDGRTMVLRDVNAEIKNIHRDGLTQGQVVGFLGPSGCGKTSLFRLLSGLQKPTAGKILAMEGDKQVPVHVGMVGVVAQHYPLFAHRTVWGNLMLAGKLGGLTEEQSAEKANGLLKRFKLDDKGSSYASEVSGGQRQRIAIIQQLMLNKTFLLMDEPFSGLDPVMKDETCRLITEVAATNELLTIIIVTHDIASAVQTSDHLWLMGRDRGSDGAFIPGAYIKEQISLADRGLAWHPEITKLPEFTSTCAEIRAKFDEL